MMRANQGTYFSRRQILGLFAATTGALVLGACGGAGAAATATIPSTASAASSTAPGATSAASPSARPSATSGAAASASGAASSSTGASGTPLSVGTDLGRILATLPVTLRDGSVPFPGEISYAHIRQQLSNYGYAETTSLGSLKGTQLDHFLLIANSLSTPPTATIFPSARADEDEWRTTVGYDFWQVDRALEWGSGWTRLEGRFDEGRIAQALIAAGRAPWQYQGETILSYGSESGEYDSNDVIIQNLGLFGDFNHVTLEEAALGCYMKTHYAETAVDVRAGRAPSLLGVPDYDALALALDPVVSVQIAPFGERYVDRSGAGTPTPAGAERLPPCTLWAMGLQDDGTTHTMIVALVYERAEQASSAAPLLHRRLENYESVVNQGRKLRDFAVPGDPQIVTAGARTVIVQPLALKDEPALQRWLAMFMTRDVAFLSEY